MHSNLERSGADGKDSRIQEFEESGVQEAKYRWVQTNTGVEPLPIVWTVSYTHLTLPTICSV